ncbi:hypothetical protein QO010_001012 [Caulobacter ginsengisoli]|uniref:DUF2029 domain-containing protein n=1 Tax=Caulobacter ginsengisoli TaxID=400775 RepID=A0ABU0IMR8_9CAUL|nr:hypothetical protein [Caulobacter ginsengisoli]MDQ0463264.1 hypothetical protein [Caulobacter ginsengisoli]
MSAARLRALLAVLAGLATLAIFAHFAALPQVALAMLPKCFAQADIIQFELAGTQDQLAAVFPAGCRSLAVPAMDAVNRWDIKAFIPAYTAFAILAAIWLGYRQKRWMVAAVVVALLAALCDLLETTTLLKLSHSLDSPGTMLTTLSIGAWGKFGLLAVHAALLMWIAYRDKRRILAALLLLIPPATALAAFDHERYAAVMSTTTLIAWTAMMLLAARETIWPRSA